MKKSAQIALLATGIFSVTGLLAIGQAQTKPEVTMILDWFVEPPHGGFYAAVQDGLYEAKGVKVNLVPGGPTIAGYSLLGSGKVEFAMTDSAGMLSAREEGVPLVGVFANFQLSPPPFRESVCSSLGATMKFDNQRKLVTSVRHHNRPRPMREER